MLNTEENSEEDYAIIKLYSGEECIVDKELYEELSKYEWKICHGYAVRYYKTNKKTTSLFMHRFIMKNVKSDQEIDHINSNRLDNRCNNLRICSRAQNAKNRLKNNKNTTGYKGVSVIQNTNKFLASITTNKIQFSIGTFDTKDMAAKAYDEVALKIFKEYSKLNFPNDTKHNYVSDNDINEFSARINGSMLIRRKPKFHRKNKKISNTSGVKCIYPNRGKFLVRICTNKIMKSYGTFSSIEDAKKMRDSIIGEDGLC